MVWGGKYNISVGVDLGMGVRKVKEATESFLLRFIATAVTKYKYSIIF